MKTLVILAHPDMTNSKINKRWIKELQKHSDSIEINDIYSKYPDFKININKEQNLIENSSNLVFEFPLFWYSMTPLLKKWLDDVLTFGWAYGVENPVLRDKKLAVAVSAGADEDGFARHRSLSELLSCFESTAYYCSSKFAGIHAFYGAESEYSQDKLDENAKEYVKFIKSL